MATPTVTFTPQQDQCTQGIAVVTGVGVSAGIGAMAGYVFNYVSPLAGALFGAAQSVTNSLLSPFLNNSLGSFGHITSLAISIFLGALVVTSAGFSMSFFASVGLYGLMLPVSLGVLAVAKWAFKCYQDGQSSTPAQPRDTSRRV